MTKRKSQADLNTEIESLIAYRKQAGDFVFSDSEKELIAQYTGNGGMNNANASANATLTEFYTPDYICELMWKLAFHYGYNGGSVLEPSVGTGRFLKHAPTNAKIEAFEVNEYTAQITKILYPDAIVHNNYFEAAFLEPDRFNKKIKGAKPTWLTNYPFDLVIGNPPYGKHSNYYSSYFKTPKLHQLEIFFLYYGLKLLKPNGLLVYVTSSNILRNGSKYDFAKMEIALLADLVDAYRLPPVFSKTSVPTDIIIFKKHK